MEAATRHEATTIGSLARAGSYASRRRLAVLAALVGLANLIVLLIQAPALVHSLVLNADNATTFVLPALAGHAPAASIVNLGDHPWYEPWWFMRATAGLPHYRALWEVEPFVATGLGIATVAACAWSALGRLAGLLCAVSLLSAGEALRDILYVPESHGLIVVHVGVLCGALLYVHNRALKGRLTPATLLLIGGPLVVFTGAGLTDQLLFVAGLAPYILAPLLCWWRFGARAWMKVSMFALVTGVLAALLALLLTHIMQEQHVIHGPFPIDFVSESLVLVNLQNLIGAFALLGGGSFFGAPVSGSNLFVFVAGVLTLLAVAVVLRALKRWGSWTVRSSESRSAEAGARELYVAFWGLVLVLVVAAFSLTSVSGQAANARYILGAWAALAALLGILYASTVPVARTATILAVCLFGLLNLRTELAVGVPPSDLGQGQRVAGKIEHFALAHGASVGYSGYSDSAPVTWETHLRVTVYPIEPCAAPTGWCPFFTAQINTWYVPRPRTRTFLVTDTRPGIVLTVGAPPASFGPPIAEEGLGEGFAIYVYNHDIAADIGS